MFFEVLGYFGLDGLLVVVCGGFVVAAVGKAFVLSGFVSVVVAPCVAFVVGCEAGVACGLAQLVVGCGLCAAKCPKKAITMRDRRAPRNKLDKVKKAPAAATKPAAPAAAKPAAPVAPKATTENK